MLERFMNVCLSISEESVPQKARVNQKRTGTEIPRDRYNLMRTRRRVNKQLAKTRSEASRSKLKLKARDIEKELQKSYRLSRDYKEHKAVSAIKTNSKFFYTYAKKFSSVKTTVGPLVDAASQINTCPWKMAEMLAAQYSKVFSTPSKPMEEPLEIFDDTIVDGQPWLHDISFDTDDIIAAIDEISQSSAAGPDRFPALLLKNCKESSKATLYDLEEIVGYWRNTSAS